MNHIIISLLSLFVFLGCASKTPTVTESADKEIKFRETYICYVDNLKLTIENRSYQELTEDEAYKVFLTASKKRNINPEQCHKKSNPPKYKKEN